MIINQGLFVDELLADETQLTTSLPVGTASSGGTAIGVDNRSLTLKGIEIEDRGCLRSAATFNRQGGASATAVLKLNKNGCVTDMTEYQQQLSEYECEQIALRQAAMLLTNTELRPGDVITINGADPTQANRVYAALLVLKHADSKLKDIKIRSAVPGCMGPTKSRIGFRQDSFEKKFISEHLKEASDSAALQIKQDEFREIKKVLRDRRAGILTHTNAQGLRVITPATQRKISDEQERDLGIAVDETLETNKKP